MKIRNVLLPALLISIVAPAMAAELETGRMRLPAVELIDQQGQPQNLRDLAAQQPLVMTFAYTTCESICPLGNAVMAEIDAATGTGVTLLTITIDPATDTPSRMARAAAEFDASPRWLWLTGDPRDIRRVLDAVDAPAGPIELHDPIFVVTDRDGRRFRRTTALPRAEEILALLDDAGR